MKSSIMIKITLLMGIFYVTTQHTRLFACNEKKPVTVWVHGSLFPLTLIPLADTVVHTLDIKYGLHPAAEQRHAVFHGKIPLYLNKVAPEQFPIETFYFFGWTGQLNFEARRKAAAQLFEDLKQFKGHPITLIGHSHGGSVILELARIAEQNNDFSLDIEQAILMAMPVQKATSPFACSPMFKNIYVLYSEGDMVQIVDPQGLYAATPKEPISPFFSERRLPEASHIRQASIWVHNFYPPHLSFALWPVIGYVPQILELMKQSTVDQKIINITKNGPEWVNG